MFKAILMVLEDATIDTLKAIPILYLVSILFSEVENV